MGIRTLIARIRNRKRKRDFLKEWRKKNAKNNVAPISIFPIDLVEIGNHSYGELNLIVYNPVSPFNLRIGSFVSIGPNVNFFLDGNHQTNKFSTFPFQSGLLNNPTAEAYLSKGNIVVEDDVWIGTGATILSGTRLGKGSVIAAGAVVTKDVVPYAIVGGVPAKIIKMRFDDRTIQRLLPLNLSNLSIKTIADHIELFYAELNEKTLQRIEDLFSVVENKLDATDSSIKKF